MCDVELQLDGEYPFSYQSPNSHKGWVQEMQISRLIACRLLGVPHFSEHDNGFENKGYKIFMLDAGKVYAVYHGDGTFWIISTKNEEVHNEAYDKYGYDIVVRSPDEDAECDTCYVIKAKGDPCPRCEHVPDSAVDELRNRFMSTTCTAAQMSALTGLNKNRISHILFAKPHLVQLTESEHDRMNAALDTMRAPAYGADK